jgi:hypothetical protein
MDPKQNNNFNNYEYQPPKIKINQQILGSLGTVQLAKCCKTNKYVLLKKLAYKLSAN